MKGDPLQFPFYSCKLKNELGSCFIASEILGHCFEQFFQLQKHPNAAPCTMYTCLAAAFAFPWQRLSHQAKVVGKFPLVWLTPLIYCPSGIITQHIK